MTVTPYVANVTWVKVFKNWPSKIFGRQPLKILKWYGLHDLLTSFKILEIFPSQLWGYEVKRLRVLLTSKTVTQEK